MQTTTKVSFPSSSQYIQGIYRVIVSHVQFYAHLKKKTKKQETQGETEVGCEWRRGQKQCLWLQRNYSSCLPHFLAILLAK